MFFAALFTKPVWKHPKCPLIGEWIKKMWYINTHTHTHTHTHTPTYIHTHNGILAIKKNDIFVTTWMDLEGIMLSEISQTEKDKYHMISLCGIKNKTKQNKETNRLLNTENQLVVAKGEVH